MGMGWLLNRRPRGGGIPAYRNIEVERVLLVGGSEPASAERWRAVAEEVTALFVRKGWGVVYCGMGGGLAGAIARGVLEAGGRVEGVLVRGAEPPDVPDGIERHEVADFHERMRVLMERTDGALVLPGGIGTLAELAQLAAWRGARLYRGQVVVYDPDEWFAPVRAYLDQAQAAGVLGASPKKLVSRATTPARITYLLQNEHMPEWAEPRTRLVPGW